MGKQVRAVASKTGAILVACFGFITFLSFPAYAIQSTNYRLDESTIGSGGLIQSNSANYIGVDALSDIAVGNAQSSNYQIDSGFYTPDTPTLSVTLGATDISLGSLSAAHASTGTAQFSVKNYTSYGYVVHISGSPFENNGYVIPALASTTAPVLGVGQFGINLASNTVPETVGATLDNGSFGFGEVEANYATPNVYRFVNGEAIAKAPKSSGFTTYTISYMVNVEGLTPGGVYASQQSIIVTGTY